MLQTHITREETAPTSWKLCVLRRLQAPSPIFPLQSPGLSPRLTRGPASVVSTRHAAQHPGKRLSTWTSAPRPQCGLSASNFTPRFLGDSHEGGFCLFCQRSGTRKVGEQTGGPKVSGPLPSSAAERSSQSKEPVLWP